MQQIPFIDLFVDLFKSAVPKAVHTVKNVFLKMGEFVARSM
jgi:hypothetical protein